MMEVTNLDIIFSVGPACRPAYHLQVNYFRRFASPLDWQMNYSLKTVLHLFETSFQDFFEVIEEENTSKFKERKVWDKKNEICSIHHFSREIDLETNQVLFREKMKRRFAHLDAEIKKSNAIGLICNREESIPHLTEFLKAFSQIYPKKKIILINIRDEDVSERKRVRHIIDENLEIHEYIFCDDAECEKEYWKGSLENWTWALGHYELPRKENFEKLESQLSNRQLVIYGAGEVAQILIERLSRNHLSVAGMAVTNMEENPKEIKGIEVRAIDAWSQEDTILVVAVKDEYIRQEMINLANQRAYKVAYFDVIYGEIRFVGDV